MSDANKISMQAPVLKNQALNKGLVSEPDMLLRNMHANTGWFLFEDSKSNQERSLFYQRRIFIWYGTNSLFTDREIPDTSADLFFVFLPGLAL
ncbi:hypothetical protein V6x_39540 [Gimesia chilikensis]|uniref:Uncharacterized protein n=1 Tax=Gimesia chilikensis TaxID=2605989 RepID=A0A517WG96_9PLAN|nr:hypothetical protein V6x_39540 [Gimesia chilikensis]